MKTIEELAKEYADKKYPQDSYGVRNVAGVVTSLDAFTAGAQSQQPIIERLRSEVEQYKKDLEDSKKREDVAKKVIEGKRSEIEKLNEENKALKKAQEWISVENELPKYGELVLIKINNEADMLSTARYQGGGNFSVDCQELYRYNVTHWRPIERR